MSFIFAILANGNLRRFPILDDAQQSIISMISCQRDRFMGDNITEIPFDGQ